MNFPLRVPLLRAHLIWSLALMYSMTENPPLMKLCCRLPLYRSVKEKKGNLKSIMDIKKWTPMNNLNIWYLKKYLAKNYCL